MSTILANLTIDVPNYWNLLNENDKREYPQLRRTIESLTVRTTRDHRAEQIDDFVEKIHRFAIRNDNKDWKRCIVWLEDAFGISTRQLCKLIPKCKSSINLAFQSIGYGTISMGTEHATQFAKIFPFMRHKVWEMRQWTIRGRNLH
jgi:hypothetical protein